MTLDQRAQRNQHHKQQVHLKVKNKAVTGDRRIQALAQPARLGQGANQVAQHTTDDHGQSGCSGLHRTPGAQHQAGHLFIRHLHRIEEHAD